MVWLFPAAISNVVSFFYFYFKWFPSRRGKSHIFISQNSARDDCDCLCTTSCKPYRCFAGLINFQIRKSNSARITWKYILTLDVESSNMVRRVHTCATTTHHPERGKKIYILKIDKHSNWKQMDFLLAFLEFSAPATEKRAHALSHTHTREKYPYVNVLNICPW